MRKILRLILPVCIILPLLFLCACASGQGETVRHDGFTIRTEKSRTSDKAEKEVPNRSVADYGEVEDYVLNKASMKFHDPSCSAVPDILEKNRWDYRGTRESVIDMGYSPCRICDP